MKVMSMSIILALKYLLHSLKIKKGYNINDHYINGHKLTKGLVKAKIYLKRSCSMIKNKNQLLTLATELTTLGLTCTKHFIRCVDMVYKRRRESADSKILTRTSKLMHFRLFFFVIWLINRSVHICVAMTMMVVLNK